MMEAVAPFLYGIIGAFGAAATLLLGVGLIVYLVRLGTEQRQDGIDLMAWGLTVYFVVMLVAILLWFFEYFAGV